MEDGQGGAGRLASPGPPHWVGGSGLHPSVDVKGRWNSSNCLHYYLLVMFSNPLTVRSCITPESLSQHHPPPPCLSFMGNYKLLFPGSSLTRFIVAVRGLDGIGRNYPCQAWLHGIATICHPRKEMKNSLILFYHGRNGK